MDSERRREPIRGALGGRGSGSKDGEEKEEVRLRGAATHRDMAA